MLNKAMIIGNVGRKPELKYTASGKAVSSFSVATNERRKDGEDVTTWHNIVVWEKLAEICAQYLNTGKMVYIEGRITTRKWQDQSGVDRYTTEIVAHQMQMLGGKDDRQQAAPIAPAAPTYQQAAPAARPAQNNMYPGTQQKYQQPVTQYEAKTYQNTGDGGQVQVDNTYNPDDDIPF